MEIKPEAQAEIILWDWLRNYGEVYFNRLNDIAELTEYREEDQNV